MIAAFTVAALSISFYNLRRVQARRRKEALQAGMFTGLAAEIIALSAVPLPPTRQTSGSGTAVPALLLAA